MATLLAFSVASVALRGDTRIKASVRRRATCGDGPRRAGEGIREALAAWTSPRPKSGIGEGLAALPLPHHRAYGSVHGGSIRLSAHASSLHQLLGVCRTFGRTRRRLRVGPFRRGLRGFTPSTRREGQLQLVVLPLAAHEITSPTCHSRSFGPSSAVPGSAYPLAASFDLAVPHEPCRRHGLLCPSADFCHAVRAPCGALNPTLADRTRSRPPEVSSPAFPAHPPDLHPRPLVDMDFVAFGRLVRT